MTLKTFARAVAIFGAVGFASIGHAESNVLPAPGTTFTPYDTVEGWNIFVNEDRKTCMIERSDDNENVVQMGLTIDRAFGYLGVFTKADVEIEDGEQSIAVLIGENVYVGTSLQITSGLRDGYKGGYIVSDDPQMVTDIMQQYSMLVFPETEGAFVINLDGTLKAIEAARECNAAQAS